MLRNNASVEVSFHSWLLHYVALCLAIAMLVLFYNDVHIMLQQLPAHRALLSFNARGAEWIVGWFDKDVFRDGLVLGTKNHAVRVAEHCDGLLNILYLSCIVLLFPFDTLLCRIYCAVWVIAFMLGLNIVRIASVLLAGAWGSKISVIVHDDVWPIILYSFMFFVVFFVALRFKKIGLKAAHDVRKVSDDLF